MEGVFWSPFSAVSGFGVGTSMAARKLNLDGPEACRDDQVVVTGRCAAC